MKSETLAVLMPYGSLWAIDDGAAGAYLDVLDGMDLGLHAREFMASRAREDAEERKPYEMIGDVAVIKLEGPMTKKPTSMSMYFGGTSTIQMRKDMRAAVADKKVRAILIDADTPGGEVAGTSDLGDEIARAAERKPVIGYVADFCASAGVWALSQCSCVLGGPGAMYGSIGTMATIYDSSRRAENDGVKVHLITSGGVKGAGTPGAAVQPAMIADRQRMVNEWTDKFVAAVARGRSMDDTQVRALATGQMWGVTDALRFGLIDGIMSMDECISCCQSGEWPDCMMAGTTGRENIFMLEGLKKLAAVFTGSAKEDKEKATAEAITAEVAEAELAVKAAQAADIRIKELEAENAALKAGTAQSGEALLAAEANKFFMAAVKANKAVPAEKKALVDAFTMSATDDGKENVIPTYSIGDGPRVKALAAMVNARPTNHYSTTELLIDDGKLEAADKKDLIAGDPTQVRALLNRLTTDTAATRGDHDGEKADESNGYKLATKKIDHDAALAMTDTGRAVLAARAKNGK